MRVGPVSALTCWVNFWGMLAIFGVIAIATRSLPDAIETAAAIDASVLEFYGCSGCSLHGHDGRSEHRW